MSANGTAEAAQRWRNYEDWITTMRQTDHDAQLLAQLAHHDPQDRRCWLNQFRRLFEK